MKSIKVLVGCEESQVVCKAFRDLGIEAYSNDILDCSGDHPEWHLKMDVFEAIKLDKWDLMIAHPECTFLTVTANKWHLPQFKDRFPTREQDRKDAIEFFIKLYNSNIKHICLENPVGVLSSQFRKPDQYVQPYWFGDPHSKKTGLWLKNLPKLIPTKIVEPAMYTYANGKKDPVWHMETSHLPEAERKRERSKAFPGFGNALAYQFSEYILKNYE